MDESVEAIQKSELSPESIKNTAPKKTGELPDQKELGNSHGRKFS